MEAIQRNPFKASLLSFDEEIIVLFLTHVASIFFLSDRLTRFAIFNRQMGFIKFAAFLYALTNIMRFRPTMSAHHLINFKDSKIHFTST